MSREICQICCGLGEIDKSPCSCCSDGYEVFTSSKPNGDPYEIAERVISEFFNNKRAV